MVPKKKTINPIAQMVAEVGALKRLYPNGEFILKTPRSFSWSSKIQPSPLSNVYEIRIDYTYADYPKIYVTDPYPLDRYPGKKHLPHVYSTKEQRICLYYPGIGGWRKDKLIAKTIVPWAFEWLLYYELWLSTGIWMGEGLHPEKDQKQELKD